NYGARVRSFPTVFGLNGSGSKLYEGDRRTPSGLYMIVDKRAHPRWRQFLLLDYPNTQDLQRYWLAMEGGGLPRRGDGYVGAGGTPGMSATSTDLRPRGALSTPGGAAHAGCSSTCTIIRSSSGSHSSSGVSDSTRISSLPLGRRRTPPGCAGLSGMTTASRDRP